MAVGVAVPPDESFRRLETATGLTSLPASEHTVLTLIFGDGWQTDVSCRLTARVPSCTETDIYAFGINLSTSRAPWDSSKDFDVTSSDQDPLSDASQTRRKVQV